LTELKVLVFGASGLLGSTLCPFLRAAGHTVQVFTRSPQYRCSSEAQIIDAFSQILDQTSPDHVLNLIGATNVDLCEEDPNYADLLNYFVPQSLSRLCPTGTHLTHISTDQVYSGDGPHKEICAHPINIYAQTKLRGEHPVIDNGGCVLRVNFFGKSNSPSRKSLSDWLVAAGRQGEHVRVFEDVLFSPLRMTSLSMVILRVIEMRLAGLFNVGAQNGISKATFARLLFKYLRLDCGLLESSSLDSVPLRAQRPLDMRMDSSHFATVTQVSLPSIEQEINHEAAEYLRT
jgi:dTDP-4-dehydrorhamnose reductase